MSYEQLAEMKKAHRELDTQVKKLAKHPGVCTLKLTELKKQKCALKTKIARLEKLAMPLPETTLKTDTVHDAEPAVVLEEDEMDIAA